MPILNDILAGLTHKDRVTAQDVIAVRRAIYPDMAISQAEAESLFAINDTAASTCLEWRQLFVEALTDYVVRQQKPSGYVNGVLGQWLADHITRDGRIKTETELDLLIHVLETAAQAPSLLSKLALDQVVAFALTPERRAGDGPTLTLEEVRRLRSLLYACAGDGAPAAVSRREAQVLFALNDAARGRPSDPAWRELFVQAIGASLLAAATYQPPSAAEALRRQAWLEAPAEGVGAFLAKTLHMRASPAAEADDRHDEGGLAVAERVTDDEAGWLIDNIGKDGAFDDNEVALLQFVAREASHLSPALQALIDRARSQPNMTQALGETAVFGRRGRI